MDTDTDRCVYVDATHCIVRVSHMYRENVSGNIMLVSNYLIHERHTIDTAAPRQTWSSQGENALARSLVRREAEDDARRKRPSRERLAVRAPPVEDGLGEAVHVR